MSIEGSNPLVVEEKQFVLVNEASPELTPTPLNIDAIKIGNFVCFVWDLKVVDTSTGSPSVFRYTMPEALKPKSTSIFVSMTTEEGGVVQVGGVAKIEAVNDNITFYKSTGLTNFGNTSNTGFASGSFSYIADNNDPL